MVFAADFPDEPHRLRLELDLNQFTSRMAAVAAATAQLNAALDQLKRPLLWEGDQA